MAFYVYVLDFDGGLLAGLWVWLEPVVLEW